MHVRWVILSCVFLLAGSASAFAQSSTWDFGVSIARIDYDLSGTGSAAGVAGRAVRHLTPNVGVELRGLFARPEQQSGAATLFAPDVQLQYRWRIGPRSVVPKCDHRIHVQRRTGWQNRRHDGHTDQEQRGTDEGNRSR